MMKDFNFYAPTRVVFGREAEEKLPQLIQQYGGRKVLVHFGGGSARRSGLLDKVEKMLWTSFSPWVAVRSSTLRRPSAMAWAIQATCGISGTARPCLSRVCPSA